MENKQYPITKEQYMQEIVKMMQITNDDILLDFIYKLLNKAG